MQLNELHNTVGYQKIRENEAIKIFKAQQILAKILYFANVSFSTVPFSVIEG